MSRRRYIIGIAGATCSGKSYLARSLDRRFRTIRRTVLPSDAYYRDLSALEPIARETRNFDTPEAIEEDLLLRHVRTLAAGGIIELPVYDFATHTRSAETVRVEPGDLIIVEGLFVLYWDEIRRMIDTKVFVSVPEQTALSRRLERDIRARGRNRESVMKQYLQTVKPMNEKYVQPTRALADIVVDGTGPIEQSSDIIFDHVVSHWKRP